MISKVQRPPEAIEYLQQSDTENPGLHELLTETLLSHRERLAGWLQPYRDNRMRGSMLPSSIEVGSDGWLINQNLTGSVLLDFNDSRPRLQKR